MTAELERERESYELEAVPDRLARLACELQRISEWARRPEHDEDILQSMGRVAWMVEWSADYMTIELVDIQREIIRWRKLWPCDPARSLLAFRADRMSQVVQALADSLTAPTDVELASSETVPVGAR